MNHYVPLTPVDGRARHSLQVVTTETGPLNQIQHGGRKGPTAAASLAILEKLFSSERGGIEIDDSLRSVIESLIDGPFGGGLFVDPGDMFFGDMSAMMDMFLGAFEGFSPTQDMAIGLFGFAMGVAGIVMPGPPWLKAAGFLGAALGAMQMEEARKKREEEKKEKEKKKGDKIIWWPIFQELEKVAARGFDNP